MHKRKLWTVINAFRGFFILFLIVPDHSISIGQELRSGKAFDVALGERISAELTNKSMRSLLASLGPERGVAVVLDRRIDPDQIVSVSLRGTPLRDAFAEIAGKAEAIVSELPNVVFIGSPTSTAKLRTLVKLRSKEISGFVNRKTLRATRDVSWLALAEPQQVLTELAQTFGLRIDNAKLIPHDLWAAATIPDADATTSLSIVLSQFGYTFEWQDKGKGIRIVPEPETVSMKTRIRLTSAAADNIVEIARERFPEAKIEKTSRAYIAVTGTVEAIEAIGRMAKGEKDSNVPERVRVDLQEFSSLNFQNASARQVLEKIRKSGIPVEWDEAAIRAAKVDLGRVVSLKFEKATTKVLFQALCDQIEVDFRVEKYRVRLFPR